VPGGDASRIDLARPGRAVGLLAAPSKQKPICARSGCFFFAPQTAKIYPVKNPTKNPPGE
jgi:hypothetical protein